MKAEYLPRGDRDSSTFDNTFQTLGSALTSPAVLVKIINNSDQDIDVSTDASTDHDFVGAGSFFLYDLRTNKGLENEYGFPTGTVFSIKGAAAGTGSVYLVVLAEVSL